MFYSAMLAVTLALSANHREAQNVMLKLPLELVSKDVRFPIFYAKNEKINCFILFDLNKGCVEALELSRGNEAADSFLDMPEDEIGSVVLHTKDKVLHIKRNIAIPFSDIQLNKFFSAKKGDVLKLWNKSYRVETCYKGFIFMRRVD